MQNLLYLLYVGNWWLVDKLHPVKIHSILGKTSYLHFQILSFSRNINLASTGFVFYGTRYLSWYNSFRYQRNLPATNVSRRCGVLITTKKGIEILRSPWNLLLSNYSLRCTYNQMKLLLCSWIRFWKRAWWRISFHQIHRLSVYFNKWLLFKEHYLKS